MDEKFICAVEEKNVKVVRMMLSNESLLDPRGGTFDEMLYYGKERLDNLFESNEPAKFDIPTDKEKWTDEVVSKMKRELNMNFSKGKLSVYSKMAKWAGRDKAEKLEEEVAKQGEILIEELAEIKKLLSKKLRNIKKKLNDTAQNQADINELKTKLERIRDFIERI